MVHQINSILDHAWAYLDDKDEAPGGEKAHVDNFRQVMAWATLKTRVSGNRQNRLKEIKKKKN